MSKKPYKPAISPKLKKLLLIIFVLFSLISVNSVYLSAIRILEYYNETSYQDFFYQYMFLGHVGLGLVLLLPALVFGIIHMLNTRNRKNKKAIKFGYVLFTCVLVLLFSGLALVRFENFTIKDPNLRNPILIAHVITPFLIAWLFVMHRLAGPRIKWEIARKIGAATAVITVAALAFHAQDPRQWNVEGPESGEKYFFPSLARTSTGNFIPQDTLMMDQYCKECHEDTHERWQHSAHKFSSFNNQAYFFSIKELRDQLMEEKGNIQASRFCAGCHDPVPFFSGAFDDPEFDMVNHVTAKAGITCTSCHAITHINSPRGNSDFTIEEPLHYPFTFSENPALKWINRQLIKANPSFHKQTFLKPLHKSTEFCGSCHKVHLPEELNDYKFLRGQNHYDSFLLSGVSGHGAMSFYYPKTGENNCNNCHMQLMSSEDFGSKSYDDKDGLFIKDHLFPSANTAIPALNNFPKWVNEAHAKYNEGVFRVDIFGIRKGQEIYDPLVAPLRPESFEVEPGKTYLFEIVIRTLKMGHHFSQGTADSNEIWLEVIAKDENDELLGQSGGMDKRGEVDPWSHFVNTLVLDKNGNRIDRRNARDIFTSLYNHQIPPGAGDALHYRLKIPKELKGKKIKFEVALKYRKFDAKYMRYIKGEDYVNNLPYLTLATDKIELGIKGKDHKVKNPAIDFPIWQRWNDFGIGMLRKPRRRIAEWELTEAKKAFEEVEKLGRQEGPINLARVFISDRQFDAAVAALERSKSFNPAPPVWTHAWLTGMVNLNNGHIDEAINSFKTVIKPTEETKARNFDFSKDYRILNELALSLFERSKRERGKKRKPKRDQYLNEARTYLEEIFKIDPENVRAHYTYSLVVSRLGDKQLAIKHRELYKKYKPDDNARDHVIAIHRDKNPAARNATEGVVIYNMNRKK